MFTEGGSLLDIKSLLGKEDGRKVVDLVQRVLTRLGYNETDGKIYGILLLSPKPLTIDELCEATNLSRTTVSTSLTKLVKGYLIHRTKNGRTKLHKATPILAAKFLRQPIEMLEMEVKPLKEAINRIINGNGFSHLKEFLSDITEAERVLSRMASGDVQ